METALETDAMPSFQRHLYVAVAVACCVATGTVLGGAVEGFRHRRLPDEARATVEAMNAIVESDVPIDAAASTACALERLPRSRAALVHLVPGAHRRLLEEGARGRVRVRQQKDFDPLTMVDEPADRPEAAAVVRDFFAGRPVDVASGTGLSDGPYPLTFDWALVLDHHSGTLFSFVLNCRD